MSTSSMTALTMLGSSSAATPQSLAAADNSLEDNSSGVLIPVATHPGVPIVSVEPLNLQPATMAVTPTPVSGNAPPPLVFSQNTFRQFFNMLKNNIDMLTGEKMNLQASLEESRWGLAEAMKQLETTKNKIIVYQTEIAASNGRLSLLEGQIAIEKKELAQFRQLPEPFSDVSPPFVVKKRVVARLGGTRAGLSSSSSRKKPRVEKLRGLQIKQLSLLAKIFKEGTQVYHSGTLGEIRSFDENSGSFTVFKGNESVKTKQQGLVYVPEEGKQYLVREYGQSLIVYHAAEITEIITRPDKESRRFKNQVSFKLKYLEGNREETVRTIRHLASLLLLSPEDAKKMLRYRQDNEYTRTVYYLEKPNEPIL